MKRAFISFDFDNDEDLRNLLSGQSKNTNSPFEIKDRSLKKHLDGDWQEKIKNRMSNVDVVIVICGQKTHLADGVAIELEIAQQKNKPYFLLEGRQGIVCRRPMSARPTDRMYKWTWSNLELLILGIR